MKKTQRRFVLSALALTAAIFVIFAFVLRAQESAPPDQGGTISFTNDASGLSDLEVELRAIENTTPHTGGGGTAGWNVLVRTTCSGQ